jgi:hypothetical protein
MTEAQLTYKKSADSWQMKVQQLVGLPFPFPWLFVAGVLFAVGAVIGFYDNKNWDAIRLLAVETVLIAALVNAVVFFEMLLDQIADVAPELLDEGKDKADKWVRRWYEEIFWSNNNIYLGFGLAALVIGVKISCNGILFTSSVGRAYAYFINFAIGVAGGSMLWTMLGIAGIMLSLGKEVHIKPSIFDTNTSTLCVASSVLWKVSFVAALAYILGISPIFLCLIKFNVLAKIIAAFFGMFIVLYFIIPQVNIHKTLLRIKRDRLGVLIKQIDSAFDNVARNPTHSNINQLRELFDVQRVVDGKKSWTFGTTELLVLLGSVLIPLIIFILDCLIRGRSR